MAYNTSQELGTNSKYGQGTYFYIGNNVDDGTAIYAQSDEDSDKYPLDGRSVILIDWQGDNTWIGTVMLFFISLYTHTYPLFASLEGCIYGRFNILACSVI